MEMERAPIVAGLFYPAEQAKLKGILDALLEPQGKGEKEKALALILPHAGYVYSGKTTGMTVSRAEVPQRALLLCPNHRGIGVNCALSPDFWRIPTATIPRAADLCAAIINHAPMVQEDRRAHEKEHSLEVLLPFLHAVQPSLRLAALSLSQLSYLQCTELAQSLSRAIQSLAAPVLVVASTDMHHFASRAQGVEKDQLALERVLAMDAQGFFETVRNNGITMCGVLPVVLTLLIALDRGATQAELVHYTDSGEASGDTTRVVGYAGLIVR